MTFAQLNRTTNATVPAAGDDRRTGPLLRDLDRAGDAFGWITPNWFASVMGTGIVANAAASLPVQLPGQRTIATAVWALAAVLLVLVSTASVVHWVRCPREARSHLLNPVMSHFYGAPPMALMTVGAGALLLGQDWIGLHAAVVVDAVVWTVGTMLGLVIAVAVPVLAFTSHQYAADSAFGGWLMPLVSPMVSATTGAMLIPHLHSQTGRQTMLWACYAMFGLSLLCALLVNPLIWARLMRHGVGAAAGVPTLWIILGPMGQSITAVNLLATHAHLAVEPGLAKAMGFFGLLYGVPMLGLALLWTAIAGVLTVRQARAGLPFSLTWWSFTFPVGTCVTGLSGLWAHTHLPAFAVLAVAYYVFLLAAWATVGVRTAHGTLVTGRLLQRPA